VRERDVLRRRRRRRRRPSSLVEPREADMRAGCAALKMLERASSLAEGLLMAGACADSMKPT